MPTTVRDLVDAPSLALELVVTGDLDRLVRWVHVTELADPSPYLDGDEFVLTAGVWQGRNTSAEEFVRAMSTRRIAGIGWGQLDPAETVPPDMVRACRAAGVPLASVPVETPFIAISTWFVDRVTAEREADLRDTLNLSRSLLAAADHDGRRADALTHVCRILSRAIGTEVVVADAAGRVIAASLGSTTAALPNPPDPDPHPADADPADPDPADPAPADPAGATSGWQRHPVLSGGRVAAVLGVLEPLRTDGAQPDPDAGTRLRSMVDTSLPVVGLVLARRRAVRETERRLAGEALSLVLSQQTQAARVRLASYGIDPDRPMVAVVLSVPDRERALEAAENWLAGERRVGVVGLRGHEVSVVIALPLRPASADGRETAPGSAPDPAPNSAPDSAATEATALARGVAVAVGAAGAGVGGVAADVGDLRRSLIEARQACAMAVRNGGGGVVGHHQTGSHRLLLALQETAVVDAFRDSVTGPVEQYDRAHGTDLMATLSRFLELDAGWKRVSDDLGVHVNTLRQRVARIETLTGRSLDRMPDRVDLWLALQVDELRGPP